QTDRRGCDAQALGAVLRRAENTQTVRCGDRDGLLSDIKALISWRTSNTLSCQLETLYPKLLRSIKNPIDSDHGIYRDHRAGGIRRSGRYATGTLRVTRA